MRRAWLVMALAMSCEARRPPRPYPVVLKVYGPAECEFPVSNGRGHDYTRRRLPWQSEEVRLFYPGHASVSVSWTPEQCPATPEQVRCEVWLFGRLWASATGVYSGDWNGMPLQGMCHAGDYLGGPGHEGYPPPSALEVRHQAMARETWGRRVRAVATDDDAQRARGHHRHLHPR